MPEQDRAAGRGTLRYPGRPRRAAAAAGRHGDLLGQLLADASDERLSDDELLGLSFLFVLAGLETVTSALSTAFAALAAHPALRRQLVADPAVIPAAVEELLRFDGPVVFVPRIATQDVEVAGQTIPAGRTSWSRSRSRAGTRPSTRIRTRSTSSARNAVSRSAAGRIAVSALRVAALGGGPGP